MIGERSLCIVMAGLVPAIHALPRDMKHVDAREEPGHDELLWSAQTKRENNPMHSRQVIDKAGPA